MRQQHDPAVRKFQRVMMRSVDIWINLAKTGQSAGGSSPPKQFAILRFLVEGDLSAGAETHRQLEITSTRKPTSQGVAKAGRDQIVRYHRRPREYVRQAVITHWKPPPHGYF